MKLVQRQIVEIPDNLARGIRSKPASEHRHLTDNQLLHQLRHGGLTVADVHVSRRSYDLLYSYALAADKVSVPGPHALTPEAVALFELLQDDFDRGLAALDEAPHLATNGAILLELVSSQKVVRAGNAYEDPYLSAGQRLHPTQLLCDETDNRDVDLVQRLVNKTYARNHPMRNAKRLKRALAFPTVVAQMLRTCGRALEHVPAARHDPSWTRLAIYQDPWAVEFAREEHVDRYQWFDACERDGLVVQFFPFERNDERPWFEQLLCTAVTSNRYALTKIPERYHSGAVLAAARLGRDLPEGYDEAQNSISMPEPRADAPGLYEFEPLPDRSVFRTFDTDGAVVERPLTPTMIADAEPETMSVKTSDGLETATKTLAKF